MVAGLRPKHHHRLNNSNSVIYSTYMTLRSNMLSFEEQTLCCNVGFLVRGDGLGKTLNPVGQPSLVYMLLLLVKLVILDSSDQLHLHKEGEFIQWRIYCYYLYKDIVRFSISIHIDISSPARYGMYRVIHQDILIVRKTKKLENL